MRRAFGSRPQTRDKTFRGSIAIEHLLFTGPHLMTLSNRCMGSITQQLICFGQHARPFSVAPRVSFSFSE